MHAIAKRAVTALFIVLLSVSGWGSFAGAEPRMQPQRTIQPRAVLPDLAAKLQSSEFRLNFKDAYLVYQPPAGGAGKGVLQIAAELNVLSYGGDWDVAQLKPYLFHLRLNSWSGFYWKVNTSRGEVYRVTGGTFGALGGAETPLNSISVEAVGDANAPERFLLHFSDAYLIKPGTSSHPQIIASNMVLKSYGSSAASRGPFLRLRRIRDRAVELIRRYDVKAPGPAAPARQLSGGNLQKVVLAREFSGQPKVLVAAAPTRGLDVGAIETVHAYLRQAAADGVAILVISEDLDEVLTLADRVAVMYEGAIVGEADARTATVEQIGLLMAGVRSEP